MSSHTSEKLYIESQFPIERQTVAAILGAYGLQRFTFSIASSGVANATIIIQCPDAKYALRVYRQGKKSTVEIEQELAFAAYLGAHGVPVAKILPATTGHNVAEVRVVGRVWQAVLMDFEPGEHPEGYPEPLLREMAGLQARMHLLGQDFVAGQPPAATAQTSLEPDPLIHAIDPEALPDPRLVAMLKRATTHRVALPADLPTGFGHFDFVDGNLLTDPAGRISAVLDFDDARIAPFIICLANTLWSIVADTPGYDAAQLYLATYQKTRRLSRAEIACLPDLLLHRHYWIWAMIVSFGNTAAPDMDSYLELEKKVQSFPKLSSPKKSSPKP